ncbi:MAG: arsenate reductase ArsC [Culicoidibacterales bacterium]
MKKIGFICVHNSCRSQMAEAWGATLLKDVATVYSAGTEDYPEIKPLAVAVMLEVGIDPSGQYPKVLAAIPTDLDIVITMGCGVECPYLGAGHQEDWGLDDPSGGPISDFRVTRDLIEDKVKILKTRIEAGEFDGGY